MNKDYFIKLLHRYQNGDLSNEEQQFLESYYNLYQNEPDVFNSMNPEEKDQLEIEIREAIWRNVSKEGKHGVKIISTHKRFLWIGAAAAVLVGIIVSLFFLYSKPKNSQASEVVFRKDRIGKNVTGNGSPHEKENRVIFLPDGSAVYLSPGSKLNYPSTFDGLKKREVFLQGEAFFDIKHNATHPFVVHSGKVETTVLGTAFNIKAQPGEKNITVTVTRGKVRVSDPNKTLGVITPQQQIIYNTEKETSTLSSVTNNSYLDWKSNDLLIDNLTLAEASKLLEEQYKIKIIIKDSSIREQRFTATFSKKENLEDAIKSICLFNGLSYNIDRKQSTVIINN